MSQKLKQDIKALRASSLAAFRACWEHLQDGLSAVEAAVQGAQLCHQALLGKHGPNPTVTRPFRRHRQLSGIQVSMCLPLCSRLGTQGRAPRPRRWLASVGPRSGSGAPMGFPGPLEGLLTLMRSLHRGRVPTEPPDSDVPGARWDIWSICSLFLHF